MKISTLQNITNIRPNFPLGKICGLYERLPDKEGLIEGGLRIEDKYKQDSPNYPLVTFVIAVYNNQKTLLRCLDSIWGQDYENIELIIIDGGSTDSTIELLKKNCDKIDYFISEPDKGVYNAINKGLTLASGSIINVLGSDDWAEQKAVKQAVDFIKNGAEMLGGRVRINNEKEGLQYLLSPQLPNYHSIFTGIPINHNSIYATRGLYEKTGYYDEKYKISADHKWILTAFYKGGIIETTNDIFTNYTLGGVSAEIEKAIDEGAQIVGDFYSFLSKEECITLYKNLTGAHLFRNDVISEWIDGNKLYHILEKYQDNQEFISALEQTICLRFTECRNRLYNIEFITENQNKKYRLKIIKLAIAALLNDTIFYNFARYFYQRFIKKGIQK